MDELLQKCWIDGDTAPTTEITNDDLLEQITAIRDTTYPLVFYNNNDIRAAYRGIGIMHRDMSLLRAAIETLGKCRKQISMAKPVIEVLNSKERAKIQGFFREEFATWPAPQVAAVKKVFQCMASMKRDNILTQLDVLVLGHLADKRNSEIVRLGNIGLALIGTLNDALSDDSDSQEQ